MIDNHKGKILEFHVINSKDLTAVEIAKGMGMSRTTLYKWFKRADVPKNVIDSFCKLTGVSADVFEKSDININNQSEPSDIVLQKVINGLFIQLEAQRISLEVISKDAEVFRNIVEKAHKEGKIRFG